MIEILNLKAHMKFIGLAAVLTVGLVAQSAQAADLCEGYGPQTPRDISNLTGKNSRLFTLATPSNTMNLCNIHLHTNAEHKGPGFSVSAGAGKHGGYKCNDTDKLSVAELKNPEGREKGMHGVKPGDTVEVHWVHTSCAVKPGPSLGSCLTDACANPELRVETQVFLVVNDENAPDFNQFAYGGNMVNGLHQPKALPAGTGEPVVFAGSTTGPKYTEKKCSPFNVTWSVRPQCMKVSIQSLDKWVANGNVFEEDHAHGVRQLVTSPELLAPIQ
jgi:hypothetical protein